MARSGVLTGVVAVVIGIVVGVIGLLTAASSIAPSPTDATNIVKVDQTGAPPIYGGN
jgi:hypothetical protein